MSLHHAAYKDVSRDVFNAVADRIAQLGEHSTSEGSWVRAPHCFF